MKITGVEAYALRAPSPVAQTYWGSKGSALDETSAKQVSDIEPSGYESTDYPPRWRMRASYSKTIDTTIVKLTTDNGLVGYGEAKAPVTPEAAREIIRQLLSPIVLDADPFDVSVLWERMYSLMRLRGHTTGFFLEAISGIDIALWDLMGKAVGMPISKLMGGQYRDKVKVYASGLPGVALATDAAALDELGKSAAALAEQGYTAVKLGVGFGLDADIKSVEAVRAATGPNFLILADAAGNYDIAQSIMIGRAFESLRVGWLETPLPPENIDGYAQVAQALALPITSDLIVSRYIAQQYLSKQALDVIQPDVCRAGGITECLRIANLADVFGVAFAPHVSIGSAIHFAATAHLGAAVPNLIISEYWIGDNPLGDAILSEPLRREGSYLYVPQGPGLGLKINEQALLKYAV